MMPNLREVKQPKTLMDLFRMDHKPQYMIKDCDGLWRVMRIVMDFRTSRFGLRFNGEYEVRTMKSDNDLETYVQEIYEIDELFDMIKAGK